MRVIVFISALTLLLTFTQFAKSKDVSQNPVGQWKSVDFVRDINNFDPEKKSWKEDLFLKEIQFIEGGNTSVSFQW